MADSFAELGLRTELLDAAAGAGLERPTAMQAAAVPVLRRGNNAVLHASTGSGVTAAYALALLDRLAEGDVPSAAGDGPAALVVVPTAERAADVATTCARLGAGAGVRARALGPGWNREAAAHVLVAPVAAALRALERSQLKVEGVQALVLDGASALLELVGREALETLLFVTPKDAQRVLVSATLTEGVERFAEAHVKKALHVPARPADPRDAAPVEARGALAYAAVPEEAKEETLARLLGNRLAERPVVTTRSASRAEVVAGRLALRGFGGDAVEVRPAGAPAEEGRPLLAHDVPADEGALLAVAESGGLALVTPAELAHLRRVAAAAGLTLEPVETPPSARDELAAFRDRVRGALESADLEAQLLVLEPLFREASAPEVAAALAALLRARPAGEAGGGQGGAPVASAGRGRAQVPSAPVPPSTAEAFVRLFVSAGTRDGLRPADLVGSIAGETSISGDRVGRIEIRDTFSVVEVPGGAAEEVIRALNGRTIRGRAVRVDFDRGRGDRPGPGGPRRTGGPGRGGPRTGGPRGPGPRGGGPGRKPPRE